MGKVVRYKHHDWDVFVDEDLKGKHTEHCLCYRCRRFKPGQPTNCTVASENYKTCVKYGLVLPVYECPWWVSGKPDLKGLEPKLTGPQEFEKILSKSARESKSSIIQIKNPKSGKFVKIDRKKGKIISSKKSSGPYKDVSLVSYPGYAGDPPNN